MGYKNLDCEVIFNKHIIKYCFLPDESCSWQIENA